MFSLNDNEENNTCIFIKKLIQKRNAMLDGEFKSVAAMLACDRGSGNEGQAFQVDGRGS